MGSSIQWCGSEQLLVFLAICRKLTGAQLSRQHDRISACIISMPELRDYRLMLCFMAAHQ